MEVYILDDLLRRDTVVDVFESLIWTERFAEIGDFELVLRATQGNQRSFIPGIQLAMNKSNLVMTVETVEGTTSADGRQQLKVKGRSLESLLEDRVALGTNGVGNITAVWSLQDTPDNIIRQIFAYICVQGQVSPDDVIPFIEPNLITSLYPADNLPSPDYEIALEQKPDSVYNAIKSLADNFDLGFRLYREDQGAAAAKLRFNVYTGSDRTAAQTTLPPVVFSPEMETLQNTKELSTIEKTKNVAIVLYIREIGGAMTVDSQTVYADGVDPDVAGFERRVLPVEITSLPDGVTDVPAYLIQQGKDALSEARPLSLLDGEIDQHSPYVYGTHYFLGDLVTMQKANGVANSMRVTEQIFAEDEQGERSYPTLVTRQFIDVGAWLSWQYNKTWADMGATEYWNTQP